MKVPAVPDVPGVGRRFRNAVNSPDGQGRTEDARNPQPPFSLTRYFSIASFLGILVVLLVLLLIYRYFALTALTDHETRGNVALARVFANTIWPTHAAYVQSASAIPRAELAQRPEAVQLRQDVLRQMTGLSVVKVKIYNLAGLTVFSTDPKQIGEDKSTNSGFVSAKAGSTATEITFRNKFDAFEQVINDRNLDDFGTGYSSLNQLKRFPLDKLKIDQSFVRGLPGDPYDLAISTAIIGMGKALNLRLIAEGVETAEQLQVLQSIGCHEIQGYYISRPMPAAEFSGFARGQPFQVALLFMDAQPMPDPVRSGNSDLSRSRI